MANASRKKTEANGSDSVLAKRQNELLSCALRRGISLGECLEAEDMEINDLRYTVNSTPIDIKPWDTASNDCQLKGTGIPVVSFFSGAGGLDLGFEAAGFQHLALVENNLMFCNTLRLNRPEWRVVGPPTHAGDISNVVDVASVLREKISIGDNFEGVFMGGPPCRPFSIAANQRFKKNGKNFKRIGFSNANEGTLLLDYIVLIEKFRPAVFIIENVPGLVDVDSGAQIKEVYNTLEKSGYAVSLPQLLDAQDYMVPQQRKRLFIIGSRNGKTWTIPTPAVTKPPSGAFLSLDNRFEGVQNHVTREHKIESVMRYRILDYGKRDALGRVDRLDPRTPSKTVIAGGMSGGGRSHLHPWIPRTLSVRECARLQTFPDDYVFTGAIARQFTQVGNAVPPVLAYHIAQSIRDSFFQ